MAAIAYPTIASCETPGFIQVKLSISHDKPKRLLFILDVPLGAYSRAVQGKLTPK